jgi:hypothetical protein
MSYVGDMSRELYNYLPPLTKIVNSETLRLPYISIPEG